MKKLLPLLTLLIFVEISFCAEPNIPAQPAQPAPPPEVNVPKDANSVVMICEDNQLTIKQIGYLSPNPDFPTVKDVADFWLNTELLYNEAVKKDLDKDAKTEFLADISYKKTIATALIEKTQSDVKISDEEVKKYYNENKNTDPRLREPNYLSFSHVTVHTIEDANAVLKRLKAGEEIDAIAKELSIAFDAKKGGQAGKYKEDTVRMRFGREFLDALNNAKEGDIIGPVKNKDGKYEIARHEGKKASHTIEFDKVKEQIKDSLENQTKKNAIDNLLKSLQENAKGRYKKVGILSGNGNTEEKSKNPVNKKD